MFDSKASEFYIEKVLTSNIHLFVLGIIIKKTAVNHNYLLNLSHL